MNEREDVDGRGDWLFDGEGEPDEAERELSESLRAARWEADVDALMRGLEAESIGLGADLPPGSRTRPTPSALRRGITSPGLEDSATPSALRRGIASPGLEESATPSALRRGIASSGLEDSATPSALRRGIRWRRGAILAAAAVLIVVNVWVLFFRAEPAWRRSSGGAWAVGEWLETGAAEHVELASDIGRVTVGPDSRVRLSRAGKDEHRLQLAEGSIDAFIFAPPKLFFVDTPGATAVDMGCAYRLDVAADGSGLLRVTGGWVELHSEPLASRVPAGAICRLEPGGAPGLPCFEDATGDFLAAVERLDRGDQTALGHALTAARPRDGLTIWHLAMRTDGGERAQVLERLAALVQPPPDVIERAYAAEPGALEEWWSAVRLAW